ncbi:MFS transporter [Streptomyces boninensis]|uniref:MFS transporter n=1 Tax=Streptomyces boninensis TaxID=2039455 RepID=UPI003B210E77
MGLTNRAAVAATGYRRRALGRLVAGVALVNLMMAGASTMATLVAVDAVGEAWSGLPNFAAVLGTAAGSLGLSARMSRRGRRAGLVLGYGLAAAGTLPAGAGAVLAAGSAPGAGLVLLAGGLFLVGAANAVAMLSRYAAADLYPPERQGAIMGTVVWGGTAGALAGPALLPLTTHLASPPEVGPYALALLALLGALVAVGGFPAADARHLSPAAAAGRRAAVRRLPSHRERPAPAPPSPHRDQVPRDQRGTSTTRVALVSMVTGQVVMVAVMTMTPVHMHTHGQGLGAVSGVLTAHLAGMFALAPLSGKLADRIGGAATIQAGLAVLVTAGVCTVLADPSAGFLLAAGLFLLGYGWNLTFVGGSALLAHRSTRLQGRVDALVWAASGVAGLGAGPLLAGAGFGALVAIACAAVTLPAALLRNHARQLARQKRTYALRSPFEGQVHPSE